MEPNKFFLVFCAVFALVNAALLFMRGFGFLGTSHKTNSPVDKDYKDWLLVAISVCITVQAFHYAFQAIGIPLSTEWTETVRWASITIPFLLVLFVLNGRVNAFINRMIEKGKQKWTYLISFLYLPRF